MEEVLNVEREKTNKYGRKERKEKITYGINKARKEIKKIRRIICKEKSYKER